MISNRGEYEKAQSELRELQDRLEILQGAQALGDKCFTKAGIRKLIARINEELNTYECSVNARTSTSE